MSTTTVKRRHSVTRTRLHRTIIERFRPEHSVIGRLRVLCRVFFRHRAYAWWALWAFLGPVQYVLAWLTERLDKVFYPQLRTMRIDRPVFILGHPRSGTTFMQNRLHDTNDACMFLTWQLWFPTLTYRAIGRPIVSLLRQLGIRTLIGAESGHEVGLDAIEEDETLFLHRLDSDILTFFSPHLLVDDDVSDFWRITGTFSRAERRRSAAFYEMAVRRQSLATGKHRIVSKFTPSVHRIAELLERFPDGRFIYLVRKPEQAIRSYLSLRDGYVAPLLTDAERRVYLRNTYRWCVDIYRAFERLKHLIPAEQLLVIRFDELTGNVTEALKRVIEFTGLRPDAGYWNQQQRHDRETYRRPHENAPLEYFGVSREEVRRDLADIYKTYGME